MRVPFAAAVALVITPVSLSAPASAQAPEAEKEERMICRSVKLTGTRFPKRVCRTQVAWKDIEERSRQAMTDMRDRPKINCVAPGGGAC